MMQGNGQITSDRLEEKKSGLEEVPYHPAHNPCLNTGLECQHHIPKEFCFGRSILVKKCTVVFCCFFHFQVVFIHLIFSLAYEERQSQTKWRNKGASFPHLLLLSDTSNVSGTVPCWADPHLQVNALRQWVLFAFFFMQSIFSPTLY